MSTDKKEQQTSESIWKIPQQVISYVGGAIRRIFGPTDDQYPATGVQPFEGEIPEEKNRN